MIATTSMTNTIHAATSAARRLIDAIRFYIYLISKAISCVSGYVAITHLAFITFFLIFVRLLGNFPGFFLKYMPDMMRALRYEGMMHGDLYLELIRTAGPTILYVTLVSMVAWIGFAIISFAGKYRNVHLAK